MKNRNHSIKRVLSGRKFTRLFEQNLDKAGVAYIIKNGKVKTSFQAVKINNFIYACFPCKTKSMDIPTEGCKLELQLIEYYYIRYDENNPLDYVAFSSCPIYIF